MKAAIFAGSFNPLHKGHQSIISKGLKLFDKIYVIVSFNPEKDYSNLEHSFTLVKDFYKNNKNIEVLLNKDRLIVDIAKELKIKFLIRSFRNLKDMRYELKMAKSNKLLNKEIETIFISPDFNLKNVSSSLIKKHKKEIEKIKSS